MTRLFLIRHGEPEADWGGADHDPGLSQVGRGQAEAAAKTLVAQGELAVISSPMRRCLETAAPYVSSRTARLAIEPRVSEVETPAGIVDRRAWLLENFPWRGGEARSWPGLDPALLAWRARMLDFVRVIHRDTAVFTHFIAINVIVSAALARQETIVCKPGYASITQIEIEGGMLRLVRLGEEMFAGEVR